MKYSDLVDEIFKLDTESKMELRDLISNYIREEQRAAIKAAGEEVEAAYVNGIVKRGTAADLLADLND